MNKKINYRNYLFNKKELKHLIHETFLHYGTNCVTFLSDNLKELGFHYATKAGISLSIEDLKVPPKKSELLSRVSSKVDNLEVKYNRGEINTVERFQNIVDIWNNASEDLKDDLVSFFKKTDPLNPLYLMAFSGARGNISQIRQLVGMRGLMADPKGQIIDIPILHNFREGLTNTDYIMSAYGARKGVVDTALKTADSGYLTRRLIDVAQDVIIREKDCLTKRSINIYIKNFEQSEFVNKVVGQASAIDVVTSDLKFIIVQKNQIITLPIANQLFKDQSIQSVKIRSPLTCELTRSICSNCYGWDLAYSKSIILGQAVGIIAAQSIGEPGTQLTMRTFHTGGTFTADSSRQIRVKKSGFIFFNENQSGKKIRTNYGIPALQLDHDLKLNIIDYTNNLSNVSLTARSTLFVENNTFIRYRQLLAELPISNEETVYSKKYILAKISGLVKIIDNLNTFWILQGNVHDIIKNSFLNTFTIGQKLSQRDSIFNFKLISKSRGIVCVNHDLNTDLVKELKIFNIVKSFNFPVFFDTAKSKYAFFDQTNNLNLLESLPSLVSNKVIKITQNVSKKYRTSSGGNIFYSKPTFFDISNSKQNFIRKNGKILYIPAEVYHINRDVTLLTVLNGSFYEDEGIELIKNGVCSRFPGFIQTEISNRIIQKISVKPGKFFEYCHLTPNEKKYLLSLNNKIFFPGEVIFEDVGVDFLSLIQITNIRNRFGLLLRPIQACNVPKRRVKIKSFDVQMDNFYSNVKFGETKSLIYESGSYVQTAKPLTLLDSFVSFQNQLSSKKTKLYLEYRFLKNKVNPNLFHISIVSNELINLSNFFSSKLTSQKLKVSLNVHSGQYVEPFLNLGKICVIPNSIFTLQELQTFFGKNSKRLMLVGDDNFGSYFTEYGFKKSLLQNTNVLKFGDFLSSNFKIQDAGYIINVEPFRCKIRKGLPLFLSKETLCFKKTNDLLKKGDILGEIAFNQIITGDIVQGLPKVEEILEARKKDYFGAPLAKYAGYVHRKKDKDSFVVKSVDFSSSETSTLFNDCLYFIPFDDSKISIGDFIKVGQPLSIASINVYVLLNIYFTYYKNLNSQEEAAYLSFKHIQFILVDRVKNIYGNQGVTIADKHVEVIIRQMTSKVQITTVDSAFLLPEEIVELKHVFYINSTLQLCNKESCKYSLLLLGITKASLLTNSFISAASFQQTTKVLMESAIEGKIDWLQGLKENVIVGRLIPSGAGFVYHSKFGLNTLDNT